MMNELKVKIEGVAPLLMHNVAMANPLGEYRRLTKPITAKRANKTDADHEMLALLDWEYGLYTKDGKIIIPDLMFERCLVGAAKNTRKGKQAASGLVVEGDAILEFPDMRLSIPDLARLPKYIDTRPVVVDRKRIMRTRPIFYEWAAAFRVLWDDALLTLDEVNAFIETGGSLCGLGDYRPRFGRFKRVS